MPSKTRRFAVRTLFKSKSKSKSNSKSKSKASKSKAPTNTRRNALRHSTVAGVMYKTGAMTNRW